MSERNQSLPENRPPERDVREEKRSDESGYFSGTSVSVQAGSHHTYLSKRYGSKLLAFPKAGELQLNVLTDFVEPDSDAIQETIFRSRPPSEHGWPPGPVISQVIEPESPLVALWPSISQTVIKYFARFKIEWQYMSIHRRRRLEKDFRKHDETLVLQADFEDEGDVKPCSNRIHSLLAEAHDLSWLDVEFLTSKLKLQGFEKIPKMGESLGVAGLRWSGGTLGGFVRLQKPGTDESIIAALTCHHVVRPTRQSASEPSKAGQSSATAQPKYDAVLDKVDVGHAAVAFTKTSELHIHVPSDKDFHEQDEQETKALQQAEESVAKEKKDLEERKEYGSPTEVQERHVKTANDVLNATKGNISKRKALNREFGTVLASSGHGRLGRHALDWALVRVNNTRIGDNTVWILAFHLHS